MIYRCPTCGSGVSRHCEDSTSCDLVACRRQERCGWFGTEDGRRSHQPVQSSR